MFLVFILIFKNGVHIDGQIKQNLIYIFVYLYIFYINSLGIQYTGINNIKCLFIYKCIWIKMFAKSIHGLLYHLPHSLFL